MNIILKAWLHRNHLTKEPNTYLASIHINGSVNLEGIIDELQKEGLELKRETALDVITRFQRKAAELVVSGYNVNTGMVHMRPVVKGVFYGSEWDPEKQPLYVAINEDAELREAIAKVKLEILGEHPNYIDILSVTDMSTGKQDGTLTKGHAAELKGSYLKIVGDDPSCGVTFTELTTRAVTKLSASEIIANEPSKLFILVPHTLPSGQYELALTTQFSRGNDSLKHPRTGVFEPLTIN